jgi:four helix bundle protein
MQADNNGLKRIGHERAGEKRQEIGARSLAYAVRAIEVYRALEKQKDGAARVIGKQYLRAATSIGANVEEAQSAESRADFIHKYGIAQKEARESLYWLRLMCESRVVPKERLKSIMRETEELYAVITAIIISTKAKGKEPQSRGHEIESGA